MRTGRCCTPGNLNHRLYPAPTWTMAWFVPAGTGCGPWGFCCWQPILCYGKDPKLAKGKGSHPDAIVHTEAAEKLGHPSIWSASFTDAPLFIFVNFDADWLGHRVGRSRSPPRTSILASGAGRTLPAARPSWPMTGARSTKWPQRGACRHDERSRVLLPRMRNGILREAGGWASPPLRRQHHRDRRRARARWHRAAPDGHRPALRREL